MEEVRKEPEKERGADPWPGSKGWAEQFAVTMRVDRSACWWRWPPPRPDWGSRVSSWVTAEARPSSNPSPWITVGHWGSLAPFPTRGTSLLRMGRKPSSYSRPVTAGPKLQPAPRSGRPGGPHLLVCPRCLDCNPWELFSAAWDPFFVQKCAMQVCALKTAAQKSPQSLPLPTPWQSRTFLEVAPFWSKSLFKGLPRCRSW